MMMKAESIARVTRIISSLLFSSVVYLKSKEHRNGEERWFEKRRFEVNKRGRRERVRRRLWVSISLWRLQLGSAATTIATTTSSLYLPTTVQSTRPPVLLVGIPNVGKSALANSLHHIGRISVAEKGKLKHATMSPLPGETKDINSLKRGNAIGSVPLAIVTGLGALTHTLGTLVLVIGASGFATTVAATAIGIVVGSFR